MRSPTALGSYLTLNVQTNLPNRMIALS